MRRGIAAFNVGLGSLGEALADCRDVELGEILVCVEDHAEPSPVNQLLAAMIRSELAHRQQLCMDCYARLGLHATDRPAAMAEAERLVEERRRRHKRREPS
jgi:hypothetical protein